MIAAHAARAPSRLAGVVSSVEVAAASTAVGATLRRELVVDAKKEGEELRVLQQGMAHWDGLFSWTKETPPKGPFMQGPRGGFYPRAHCRTDAAARPSMSARQPM